MHSSRDSVRQIIGTFMGADLARPCWFHLLNMCGFRSDEAVLALRVGDNWQHVDEARVRHGHAGTMLAPELTHTMLNGLIPGIPLYLIIPTTTLFLRAGRAKELGFSFALNITGAGGGIWDFRASDAGWRVE